ncbi:hypothetical protein [Aquimarina litoralis]|uniref:hypothetical protein n=1 Tax=Aquimarina litoralis TaxID=584605 RepID=UPI001FE668B7|nr:hypothetical protein [Aquimarina litoralis]
MIDFLLTSDDPLSKLLVEKGITSWHTLIDFIKNVPYGRNANRTDSKLVITENRGTCSSKHALLKKIANLHQQTDIELIIGIYKMNATNTPKIGTVLTDHDLTYIPEAHTYLRYHNITIDATSVNSNFDLIKDDLLLEEIIQPDQVGEYKVNYHQNYIKNWIISEEVDFSFTKIWELREQCIANLSL